MPNPLSVFGGTLAEGLTSETSFGIFQPDIIPQADEEQHPYAASAGRAAGAMAGFIGTTMATGGLIGAALRTPKWLGLGLKATKWGTAILESSGGAGLKAQANYGKLMRVPGGMLIMGSNFGIQNFAREFVDQMKNEDPNAHDLGVATARGALPGGIFGMAYNATVFAGRSTQIVSGGVAFATAGAVMRHADGEPVLSKNIITDFVVGAALSSLGASSGAERLRRATAEQSAREKAALDVLAEIENPKVGLGIVASRFLQKHEPGVVELLEKNGLDLKSFESASEQQLGRAVGTLKRGGLKATVGEEGRVVAEANKSIRGQVYPFFDTLGMTKKTKPGLVKTGETHYYDNPATPNWGGGTPVYIRDKSHTVFNDMGRGVIKNMLGKDVERPSQLTTGEAKYVYDTLAHIGAADLGVDIMTFRASGVGNSGYIMGSAEQHMMNFNLMTLVDPLIKSYRTKNVLVNAIKEDYNAAGRVIRIDMNVLGKEGVQKWFNGQETPTSFPIIWDNMSLQPSQFETFVNGLKPEVRAAYKDVVKYRDIMYNRTNATLRLLGEPEFPNRESYMRTVIAQADDAARKRLGGMNELGKMRENPALTKKKQKTSKGEVISTFIPDSGFLAREGNPQIVKDPFRALDLMIENDLRVMLMEQPTRILAHKLNTLEAAGIIDRASKLTAIDFYNTFLINVPTKLNQQTNAYLAGLITSDLAKKGRIDKIFGALTKRIVGRDMTQQPLDGMSTAFGKTVVNTYLAGRPDLNIRNAMQFTFWHPLTDTFTAIKAMVRPVPKVALEHAQQSTSYRASISGIAQESQTGTMGQFEKEMMRPYQASHEQWNVKQNGVNITYYNLLNYVNNPRLRKHNWWTEAGDKLRKDTGDNNLLAHDEWNRFVRALDTDIPQVQFVYDAPGLPGAYQSVGRAGVRLQSFTMNYFGNYLPKLWKEMVTGKPAWAKPEENITLPVERRLGIVKHFVGLSILVGAMRRAGIEMGDIAGVTFDPWKPGAASSDENIVKQITSRTTLGIFGFRPSPAVSAVGGLGDAFFGQNEYERTAGLNRFKDSWLLATGLFAPGGLTVRQLYTASEDKELERLIFRKPKQPTGRRIIFDTGRSNTRSSTRSSTQSSDR